MSQPTGIEEIDRILFRDEPVVVTDRQTGDCCLDQRHRWEVIGMGQAYKLGSRWDPDLIGSVMDCGCRAWCFDSFAAAEKWMNDQGLDL